MDPVTKTCKAEGESECSAINHAGCLRQAERQESRVLIFRMKIKLKMRDSVFFSDFTSRSCIIGKIKCFVYLCSS